MSDTYPIQNDFLKKVTQIIEENLSNEQYGVSELARDVGMSRSNLLRKVRKLTDLSVSQFIRQVRLRNAMEMLRENSLNISEISYAVGFSSPSYFIKCFHDHFGYPPGEAGKHSPEESEKTEKTGKGALNKKRIFIAGSVLSVVLIIIFLLIWYPFKSRQKEPKKSIAVLPFKNDSSDSTNVYIINGLMESILNNLQKIEGLRVISRTSVEAYRHSHKTLSQIAKELNVNYIIEGSGQKNANQILLNIQLIEASTDNHLWAEQYQRELKDIFALQNEVAKNIASQIQVFLTPDEIKRIEEVPTHNLEAYDYFLKGREYFNKIDPGEMDEAIVYFKKAIELDDKFAWAYADIAIAYYMIDLYQAEKKYTDQINTYADKALLYDSQLAQSLIAKALYFMDTYQNDLALPYLLKALEYNPNSAMVINILSEFYVNYAPDTEKYLEYALKGARLDISSNDSVTASYIYLHISNAFIQTGFVDQAAKYIQKSLEFNPNNGYSKLVKAYIDYSKTLNLEQTRDELLKIYTEDTTRLDILQELGKICYYMRDYKQAHFYYKKFLDIKAALKLDMYVYEDAKMGLVFDKLGYKAESEKLFADYKNYADQDKSIYQHLSMAVYYAYFANNQEALKQLELFSEENNFHYWVILFLKIDPLTDNIKDLPEYQKLIKKIEKKFWKEHYQIKVSLEDKDLL